MVLLPLLPCTTETEFGEAAMVKAGVAEAVTVSATLADSVRPPPVPVTVMEYVPVAVDDPTARVRAELPEPGAAMDVGLNDAVVPAGRPDALSATALLNPPETVVVMVLLPLLPCTTETEVGEAAMVKEGVAPAVTVSEAVALCEVPPLVPVAVIVYVPVAVVEATAIVMVDVPEPGAAMDVGLKLTVTPVGWPLAVKATAALNPPETALVIVDVPLLPCTTETEVGEAEMLKAGLDELPVRALIRPWPFGLPQPVTRSYPVTAE
jgi:hypothetical protein